MHGLLGVELKEGVCEFGSTMLFLVEGFGSSGEVVASSRHGCTKSTAFAVRKSWPCGDFA